LPIRINGGTRHIGAAPDELRGYTMEIQRGPEQATRRNNRHVCDPNGSAIFLKTSEPREEDFSISRAKCAPI
jgi:hypothetical protein